MPIESSPEGADVDNTSPVLGSALHIACADCVPNRYTDHNTFDNFS